MKVDIAKKIGIVGVGNVGGALLFTFKRLGHTCLIHDIKLNTTINDVLESEVVYICVPTPCLEDGSCDTSKIEATVAELNDLEYKGLICVKSTVVPGTTQHLIDAYPDLSICFVPEFLRQSLAKVDFLEHHDVLIVGTHSEAFAEKVFEHHKEFAKTMVQVNPTEAEYCKYFNNAYNAMLITFANSIYEMCEAQPEQVDYMKIKAAIVHRQHIYDRYLDCNQNFRGFGGACLPKDVTALDDHRKNLGLNLKLFSTILSENEKLPPPPPPHLADRE